VNAAAIPKAVAHAAAGARPGRMVSLSANAAGASGSWPGWDQALGRTGSAPRS
jgi:hypothetical protein